MPAFRGISGRAIQVQPVLPSDGEPSRQRRKERVKCLNCPGYIGLDQADYITLCSPCQRKRDVRDIPAEETMYALRNLANEGNVGQGRKPGKFLPGLKPLLKRKGIKVNDLTDMIGCKSATHVSKHVSQRGTASPKTIERYCEALRCEPSDLLTKPAETS